MASSDISVEQWLQHKALIYLHYITEDKTLEHTRAIMKDVHGFKATSAKFMSAAKTLAHPFSKTQYTTKLTAWGFRKNNRSTIYACIEGSLKRKRVDLASVESVTISAHEGDKLIPYKKLKKALNRSKKSKEQANLPADVPSPPGLRVQYRPQNQFSDIDLHQYPCFRFIIELFNTLKIRLNFLNTGFASQQNGNNQNCSPSAKISAGIAELLDDSDIECCSQLPLSFRRACKSLCTTQYRGMELLFQALFLISNNQLNTLNTGGFGEWLAKNVEVSSLCKLQSWAAKTLLTILLHGAVGMDDVTILRAAHTAGENLSSHILSESKSSLLQHSLMCSSLQCARYLIDIGTDVGTTGTHQKSSHPTEDALDRHSSTPLVIASRSYRCVEMIPALLAHGASIHGILLLRDCIRSGATCNTIKALLCAGASPNEEDALSVSASLGRCDVMEVLLSAGACVNGTCELNGSGFSSFVKYRTPAIAAAESKCAEAIEVLMRHGVDLDASWLDCIDQDARETILHEISISKSLYRTTELCFHPIQAAVRAGDCDFVDFMIRNGTSLSSQYGHPAIVFAAQSSDVAMMTFLLANGADPNMISKSGLAVTALEAAASRGCLPGVRLLLNMGVDPDFCSQRPGSRTALQRAAERGQTDVVELLLASGADIQAPPCPIDGVSTLEALISCGKLELVIRALGAGAFVNAFPGTNGSPLLTAIEEGNRDLVCLLVRLGADVCYAAERSAILSSGDILPLQLAAMSEDDVEMCKILINNGADVDGVTPDRKETPFALACSYGHESVARYLMSRNANLYGNATSHSNTPLYIAIFWQYVNIVRLLLESGVSANRFFGSSSYGSCGNHMKEHSTPLIEVCEVEYEDDYELGEEEANDYELEEEEVNDMALLLLEYGAKVNLRPSLHSNTPLQIACLNDQSKLAKLLVSYGADVNAPCPIRTKDSMRETTVSGLSRGFNALQAVILHQNTEMVDFLLSKGANVHVAVSPDMQFTALQVAAAEGNIPIVERLLKAGARVDEPASKLEGRTAFQGAAENGRLEVLRLLLHHYHGTHIAEICDDAAKFAHKNFHNHVVGFLREYKERHTRSPAVERQEAVILDEWINWENTP